MMVRGGLTSDLPGAGKRGGAAVFDADEDADLGEEYEDGKRLKEVKLGKGGCGVEKLMLLGVKSLIKLQ